MEIWKDIVGFEGIYKISNTGRVVSLPKTKIECGRKSGNELKEKIGRAGYIYVALRKDKKQNNYLIHRLIAKAFIPNTNNKPCINHINSIRTDNRIENLEWCTYSENNSHAHKVGGQGKYVGEKHSQSKLTKLQVEEIRAKYKKYKYTMIMLSLEYGASKSAIQAIINNKTWKNEQHNKQCK